MTRGPPPPPIPSKTYISSFLQTTNLPHIYYLQTFPIIIIYKPSLYLLSTILPYIYYLQLLFIIKSNCRSVAGVSFVQGDVKKTNFCCFNNKNGVLYRGVNFLSLIRYSHIYFNIKI